MKNLLKKTISILTALVMLLCGVSALADETEAAGEAKIPTFEAGKGMKGTLSPDQAAVFRVHAGRGGKVRFTLSLMEDCDVSVAVDGSRTGLGRADENLPVYTFTRQIERDACCVISITAGRGTAYSIASDLIPEAPAPEAAPAEAPEVDQEKAAEPAEEPAKQPAEEPVKEQVNEPAEEPTDEPVKEPEKEPEEETVTAAEPETEPHEPASAEAADGQEAEAPSTETAPEPEQPETTPTEAGDGQEEENVSAEPGTETGPAEQEEPIPENNETPEQPEEAADQNGGQDSSENTESAAGSMEIIIAKSLTPDESWSGTVRNRKPTILKLDVNQPGTIHMLVRGRNVCCSVQKSDRITEDAEQVPTDSETNRSITTWTAEVGAYLISVRAGESSLMAKAEVSFMNDEEFEAWEAEQAEPDNETADPEETVEEESENRPESENKPERSINVEITWDVPDPVIGATAHFSARLNGYEELNYTVQWQYSPDKETWYDLPGETEQTMDVKVTEENNLVYWRIQVFVEDDQEN